MNARNIITGMLLLCVGAVAAADTITFTEKLSDRVVTYRDPETRETITEVARTVSGAIRAVVTLPGLSQRSLQQFSTWTLELGGSSFTEDFSNADLLNDNKAVFIAYEQDDNDRARETGRLTIKRSGDTLTLTADSSVLEDGSFAAESLAEVSDDSDQVTGSVSFHFSLDDFSVDQTLFYQGKRKAIQRSVGGEGGEDSTLYDIQLTGEADTGKPALSIATPRKGFRTTNDTAIVRGRATDKYGVAAMILSVNGEPADLQDFDEETGDWSALVALAPGMNRIEVEGVDFSGNEAVAQLDVQRVVVSPLRLTQTTGGTVTGLAPGQPLEVGKTYQLTAKSDAQHLLRHWLVGGDTQSGTTLQFVMEPDLAIHAEFVVNKFPAASGTYQGLFQPVATGEGEGELSVNPTNSGHVTLTLTDKGSVSGKLLMGGARIPLSGRCDTEGRMILDLERKGLPATRLDVQFDLDENIGDADGSITTTEGTSALSASRPATREQAEAFDGRRTFVIPGADAEEAAVFPVGNGAGAMTLKRGALRLSGNLGDGTPITYAGQVDNDGRLPLYVSIKGGKQIAIGWIELGELPENASPDTIVWMKSPTPKDALYPHGFQTLSGFIHAPYTPPARGETGLDWIDGIVLIDGGNLTATLTNRVQIVGTKADLLDGNPSRITLKLAPKTGLFTGSFVHPATRKSVKTKGAWLQASETTPAQGGGWFQGSNESGYVEFLPALPE